MAVLLPENKAEWWAPSVDDCFYCGEAVAWAVPCVFWHGHDHGIVLHIDCALSFASALAGDAREAALSSGVPPWDTRASIERSRIA